VKTNAPDDRNKSPAQGSKVTALFLASSNSGKLREYRALGASGAAAAVELELLPNFDRLPAFDESATTFAENAAGKALHYSHFSETPVIADDSGLVVGALGGAPGVRSARYAGPQASDADRIGKLLSELRASGSADRSARFVCVIAVAERGRMVCVVTAAVEGNILDSPRGASGFGYDPVFYFPPLKVTFAEVEQEEKNLYSHRGQAFRKVQQFLVSLPTRVAAHP
jgi:XTP/dITP diphosphohydrolase